MNWDDDRPRPAKQIIVGEVLSNLSVDELSERIAALQNEVSRVERELAGKRTQNAAADKLFKS